MSGVSSAPSVDLAVLTLPEGGAELELLQLAGGRAGEFVAELDPLRALVAGDAGAWPRRSRRPRSACCPGPVTTSAVTSSPHFSSGMPMTATSVTSGCWKMASSTSIDDTFSPPEMITSFLRSEMITYCVVVDRAAVAGVEEPVVDRRGGRLGLVPVALHDHVAAGEDLAVAVDAPSSQPTTGAPARFSLTARSAGTGRRTRRACGSS